MNVLCCRLRKRRTLGCPFTSRTASICGGYILPSDCQRLGSKGMCVIESSTALRVAQICSYASLKEATKGALSSCCKNAANRTRFGRSRRRRNRDPSWLVYMTLSYNRFLRKNTPDAPLGSPTMVCTCDHGLSSSKTTTPRGAWYFTTAVLERELASATRSGRRTRANNRVLERRSRPLHLLAILAPRA